MGVAGRSALNRNTKMARFLGGVRAMIGLLEIGLSFLKSG
jgi:hypothetical protein